VLTDRFDWFISLDCLNSSPPLWPTDMLHFKPMHARGVVYISYVVQKIIYLS